MLHFFEFVPLCFKNVHTVRYDTEAESAAVFQKSDPPCIFSPAKPERGNVLSDHLQTLRLPHDNLEANGDCGYKARTIEETQSPKLHVPQRSMFKCNRNVVLEHPDNHCPVLRGLAFQMVYMSTNPDNGVRDHGSVLFVMFVSQLFKVFLFAVRSVENFIDQRNEKLRHFCAMVRNTSSKIVLCSVVFSVSASGNEVVKMSVFPM